MNLEAQYPLTFVSSQVEILKKIIFNINPFTAFADWFKSKVTLTINHPFGFIVKTPESILLNGHIVNL